MYSIGKFAKAIGMSVLTVRNWHKCGDLIPSKITNGGTRYYSQRQLDEYLGVKHANRKNYIYARVSGSSQKDDLANQIEFLRTFANARGLICEVIQDIGSGLNYKRKEWNALISMVEAGDVDKIIVSHKDRFVRFGFDWFNSFCEKHNTEIIVVNNEKTTPNQELIEDLISIIHVFSCRIYGLRKYKNKIKGDRDVSSI